MNTISAMKVIAFLTACFASMAFAEDFKTVNGKEYKDLAVTRIEPDGLVLRTKSGISKVYFTELSKEIQERFHYVDSAEVEANEAAALSTKEQRAAETLRQSAEYFRTIEMQAARTYESSEKGTLSGQIFVATKGRENARLGASQVSLLARDAVDAVLAGTYAFGAAKSERLRSDIAAAGAVYEQARVAAEQAEALVKRNRYLYENGYDRSTGVTAITVAEQAANTARNTESAAKEQLESLLAELSYYHSHDFYFSYLANPILTAESDAEGKFTMQVPRKGEYVIAAQTDRRVWNETENYYWLQPVSLNGQKEGVMNLSNNNLYLVRTAEAD